MRARRFRLVALSLVAALSLGAGRAEQGPPAGAGLSLLDVVRLTLENDPNVALQEARIQAQQGAVAVASSLFDPLVTSLVTGAESRDPLTTDSVTRSRNFDTTLGLDQLFRTGLSLEPRISLNRSEDPASAAAARNDGSLTLRIRQPLLRGRGRIANVAGEQAALRVLAATELEVWHETARRIQAAVGQYWTVAAAVLDLEVLRASESSARELLSTTRKLIDADQLPAAEVVQLEANLAAQESATIGGERQLFAARQDLGREIGLPAAAIGALPLPGDPFPSILPSELPPQEVTVSWTEEALRRRGDLRASRERLEGADLLRRGAEAALRPRLDLVLAPSYSGLDEGRGLSSYFSPLYRNVPGLGASLTLDFSWPTLNRRAEGTLLQSDAARRQSAAALDLVEKAIGADVPAAFDAIRRDVQRLEKSREAVLLFERAVTNEEKKLRAGTSTLIDLISQRDRLTAARQAEVRAKFSLSLSLLQFRFETGTLLALPQGGDGAGGEVEVELVSSRLTTLPRFDEGGRP